MTDSTTTATTAPANMPTETEAPAITPTATTPEAPALDIDAPAIPPETALATALAPAETPAKTTPTAPLEPPTVTTPPAPPLPPPWWITHYRLNIIAHCAEVSMVVRLERDAAAPFLAAGRAKEAAFREAVALAIKGSPAHEIYRTAAARLVDLDKEQDRIKTTLADIAEQIKKPLDPDRITEIASQEPGLRSRLDIIRRAREHAQAARDQASRDLHAVSKEIIRGLQIESMAELDTLEKTAAGLLDSARQQLGELVAAGFFGGFVRNLTDFLAQQNAETLIGGPVPQAPLVAMPEQQGRQEAFGMQAFGDHGAKIPHHWTTFGPGQIRETAK